MAGADGGTATGRSGEMEVETSPPMPTAMPTPRTPHPTASALFASLDAELLLRRTGVSTAASGGTRQQNNKGEGETRSPSSLSSSLIARRTRSLGWRGRYSQADLYPVRLELGDICLPTTPSSCPAEVTFNVQQVQGGETTGTYGTGATVWPASMVLLKYMEALAGRREEGCDDKNNDGSRPFLWPLLRGRGTVADLGAGTAITSVAAAALGASLVVCTDGCDAVVELARDNVRRALGDLRRGAANEKKGRASRWDRNGNGNEGTERGIRIGDCDAGEEVLLGGR